MCKNEEEKEMPTVIDISAVKSSEITFKSNEELKNFNRLVNHPSEPNERVKKLMSQYKKMKDNK